MDAHHLWFSMLTFISQTLQTSIIQWSYRRYQFNIVWEKNERQIPVVYKLFNLDSCYWTLKPPSSLRKVSLQVEKRVHH